ncbi:oxygen-independent coproporphyrinogen-3 oxidase [Catalinimonas alkaloidigena]|uniref:Heme chaperone HemW n=1 Tax=Catalinimonas alkaloidigena TaxID=1075417 RepID=A0A1G9MN92_9BACT|nr:oxygen-independent coproporphyrinogen-3 oxidase [Catalinimonas alkaloidigena]
MVQALQHELTLQVPYLENHAVQTIYFGGGTPSLLEEAELQALLETIHRLYNVGPRPEITLEANPDDLTTDKLAILRRCGINRLSIGIQSFHEPHLRFLHRAHNASQATTCVQQAQEYGFENLTIDLIYGIPADTHAIWQQDLAQALQLQVPHISAYCLTIEPQTVFGHWQRKGKLTPVSDEFAAEQFEQLVATLTQQGYEHYEISNFAQPGRYSRHNRNYWCGEPYLGVGPSAHSYDGRNRQFNVAHNAKYVQALAKHEIPFTMDELSPENAANEYLMTSLRTQWGCDLEHLQEKYGFALTAEQQQYIAHATQRGLMQQQGATLLLTEKGKLLADELAADLFYVES